MGGALQDLRRQFLLEVLIQSAMGILAGLGLGALSVPMLQGMGVEDRQAAQWVSEISGGDGFHGHVPSVKLQFEISTVTMALLAGGALLLAVLAAFLITRRLAAINPGQLLSQDL